MNDTALYADILLPACHWFETEDLRVRYYCNPYLLWNEKAVEPLYESKPDFEIYKLIAEAMGYGDFFQFTADEYPERCPLHPLWAGNAGITIDKIREKRYLRCDNDPTIAFEGGVFGTATGRAMFYREAPQPDYNVGPGIGFGEREVVRVLGAGSRGRSLQSHSREVPLHHLL